MMCGGTENANKCSEECAVSPLGNTKFSLKHYAMKTYGGADIYIHVFLTSALEGGSVELHAPAVPP
jgi:hypothetical protein